MTADAIVCFNCEGRGTDFFFPYIESLIHADAGYWLDTPDLERFGVLCPYCDGEGGGVDFFPSVWLIWGPQGDA